MKKIPTIFIRDWAGDRSRVLDQINPDAQWVFDGEGVATIKYDGAGCMIRDGKMYRRHELKPGKKAPPLWEAADDVDPETGRQVGWVPVGTGAEDKWFVVALSNAFETVPDDKVPDGTYEAIGPHFQGNPQGVPEDTLVKHGYQKMDWMRMTSFEDLKRVLGHSAMEGIVWHHPDGRMAKIKARDFGLPWPKK